MIVAYNALSVRPGVADGGATYSLNILRKLPAALPEADFVVYLDAAERRLDGVDALTLRRIPKRGGAADRIVRETFGLARRLRRDRADVLISPNESIPFGSPCPILVVAQNLVYHRDDVSTAFAGATPAQRFVSRVQAGYYRRRMAAAYLRADVVVAVSEETARVLAARAQLPLEKTVVVYEGADSFLVPGHRDLPRVPRLLAVGTLAPYKGLRETLELFAVLHRSRPELQLELVGSDWRGYRSTLERHAAQLGVTRAVRFRGGVDPDELARLYDTSMVLLALSSCESFGLPVVEAMSRGLPVVAAARSSLPEVTAGAAVLVDPADVETAAAGTRKLLEDGTEWQRHVRIGRQRAAELSWDRAAAGVASALRRAVSRGAG